MKKENTILPESKNIHVLSNSEETGKAAGRAIEACLIEKQKTQKEIRMIFAAAPSQNATLDYLTQSTKINWGKIVAFHMDEYLGLKKDAPQLFSNYLENHLFSKVKLKKKHLIRPHNSFQKESERYKNLLKEAPVDIICLGIGENGHIAFNDPPVANFNDSEIIKVVELDQKCKLQQVRDGAFPSVNEVPDRALSLTIPTLMAGENLFCIVVGSHKQNAVNGTLKGPISTTCPASILRTHPNCHFYFDEKAYAKV